MKILGIDYGKKKIGLAFGETESKLAQPLKVIRFKSDKEAVEKVFKISQLTQVSQVVIGMSEGRMAKETGKFANDLKKKLHIPIKFQDETLSTKEAQSLSIEAGIKRNKRRRMEDAYSATLILQDHLDKYEE